MQSQPAEDHRLSRGIKGRNLLGGAAAVVAAVMLSGASGCVFWDPAHAKIPVPPVSLGARDVAFPSGSGNEIRAWFARGERGGGAVLLLHGVGSNRTSMTARARLLHGEGFTVLAPDFQAHGESTGDVITYGARESLDAEAALEFLRRKVPGERIGVIGVSMGGAASLLGPGPLPADAFVLESVYPTIGQAVRDRLTAWLGPLGAVGELIAPAMTDLLGAEIGVSASQLQPITRIGALRAPVLVIAGTKDRYTHLAEAESLYARAPEPKRFWAVPGAGHEDLFAFAGQEYARRVSAFLEEYLRAAPYVAESADSATAEHIGRRTRETP